MVLIKLNLEDCADREFASTNIYLSGKKILNPEFRFFFINQLPKSTKINIPFKRIDNGIFKGMNKNFNQSSCINKRPANWIAKVKTFHSSHSTFPPEDLAL